MARLSDLVCVESCLLGKGPTELASQVFLHIIRLFPCQQGAFCVGSPESCLPANLSSISSVRMAGSECHSSESFLLETGLLGSSCNGLQVTGNTACHPSPRRELASQLPASLL